MGSQTWLGESASRCWAMPRVEEAVAVSHRPWFVLSTYPQCEYKAWAATQY